VAAARVIVKAHQQVFHRSGAGSVVDPAHNAIDRVPQLELLHGPLAGLISEIQAFGDNAIQPMPELS
jgi:hypothetical protein